MNAQTWLKDLKEAETNRSNSHLFHFELIVISIFSGYWYNSWTIGVVAFFALLVLSGFRFLTVTLDSLPNPFRVLLISNFCYLLNEI